MLMQALLLRRNVSFFSLALLTPEIQSRGVWCGDCGDHLMSLFETGSPVYHVHTILSEAFVMI